MTEKSPLVDSASKIASTAAAAISTSVPEVVPVSGTYNGADDSNSNSGSFAAWFSRLDNGETNAPLTTTTSGNRFATTLRRWSFFPCFSQSTESAIAGNAFDLIIVYDSERGTIACNDAIHTFQHASAVNKCNKACCCSCKSASFVPQACCVGIESFDETTLYLEVVQTSGTGVNDANKIIFPIINNKIRSPGSSVINCDFMDDRYDSTYSIDDGYGRKNSPTSKEENDHDKSVLWELVSLLNAGCNLARYVLVNSEGTILGIAPLNIHLWNSSVKIFVVDIDGTITRSNVAGIVDTILLEQYSHCHEGICDFLALANNLKVLYLTSRPISLANSTRKFLSNMKQGNGRLPEGPIIGFPGSLAQVLYMELVTHNVNAYKTHVLQEQVGRLFRCNGVEDYLDAAIGNTVMDVQAYHEAGLHVHHIYWIDRQSRIACLDKDTIMPRTVSGVPFDYTTLRGTSFQGYCDRRLLEHFRDRRGKKKQCLSLQSDSPPLT